MATAPATHGPAWAETLRQQGRAGFETLGLPSTKREPWRYFPTRALGRFDLVDGGPTSATLGSAELAGYYLEDVAATVVVVDGRVDLGHSRLADLPAGVKVRSLRAAVAADAPGLVDLLGQVVDADVDGLVAANQANDTDGVYVLVDKNVALTQPLSVLFVTTDAAKDGVVSVRNVVKLERSSQLTLAIRHVSLTAAKYAVNVVTEVQLGDNAALEHIKLLDEGEAAHHVEAFGADLGRDARLTSLVVSLGGLEARTAIRANLRAPGGECVLNGLYLGQGKQRLDHYTAIDHIAPHCTSSEYYAGILDDSSVGTFQGVVYFRKDAVKSATEQLNRNLLLSDGAQANTKPQLEIDNDDVKAAHGSTVGQLDEGALFYLAARGIDPETARGVLTFAFAREVVEKVAHAGLRGLLVGRVAETLGTTEMVENEVDLDALGDELDTGAEA